MTEKQQPKRPSTDPRRERGEPSEKRQRDANANTEERRGEGRTDGPGPKVERLRDTDPDYSS